MCSLDESYTGPIDDNLLSLADIFGNVNFEITKTECETKQCIWEDLKKEEDRSTLIKKKLECSSLYIDFCERVADNEDVTEYPWLQECYDRSNRVLMVDPRDEVAGTHSFTGCTHDSAVPDFTESTFHNTLAGPTYAMKYFDIETKNKAIPAGYAWGTLGYGEDAPEILLGPSVVIDVSKTSYLKEYGKPMEKYMYTKYTITSVTRGFDWEDILILNGEVIFEDLTLKDVTFYDIDFTIMNIRFKNVVFEMLISMD